MAELNEERINEREVKNLRESIEALQLAQDAAQDAQIKHERLQRKLAVLYKLRGRDSIDAFGYILREKRT